jgi:excisionase family DNA binding protein
MYKQVASSIDSGVTDSIPERRRPGGGLRDKASINPILELIEVLKMPNIGTVKEVKSFLKLSESTIYKLIYEGEIPAFRIGDSWRFDMDEIKVMVEKAKKRVKDSLKAS